MFLWDEVYEIRSVCFWSKISNNVVRRIFDSSNMFLRHVPTMALTMVLLLVMLLVKMVEAIKYNAIEV